MSGTQDANAAAQIRFPLSREHISGFASRSAVLGQVLGAGEVTRVLASYQREDVRSGEAQRRFARVASQLNCAVLATAMLGAAILALGILQPNLGQGATSWPARLVPDALFALGLFGLIAGGYATARLYQLNSGDLAGDWMRTRARAEKYRSEYFERLVARVPPADSSALLAALELVHQHLLEDQIDYFGRRGKRHETSAVRWLGLAAFATGAASVGVAAGGMAGTAGQQWILAIAALGGIGGALASFAAAQESIGQERERAQRFRNNVDALELVARQIDGVREAVAAGSKDALVTFTAAINQQLALELGQFLEGGDSIRAALTKLGQQIEDSRKRQDVADPGQHV